MAGIFERALKRLDATPEERVATTLAFETIDAAKLADRLELETQGADRGKRNEPFSDAEAFDSVENTIIAELEEYRRKAIDRMTRSLEAYSARLQALDFENARVDILAAIEQAKADFIAEVHQGANTLFQKRRSVIEATNDVEQFRREHGITRQAHLPDSKIWIAGVLLALLIVEALGNGALFSGGLSGGFLEGSVVALGIAAINVIVGFAIGLYVVRFILYRNWFIRIAAFAGLLLELGFNAFVNLGVGRFRSALNSADPDAALFSAFGISPVEAFRQITEITGFQSYVLICLGIVFHLAAMFDGFKLDDPYPFYGTYWRIRETAENDYSQTKEGLIQFLTEKRDETIAEMQEASRSLTGARRIASRIAENRIQTQQRFRSYMDSLVTTGNQLLTYYREVNTRNRSTKAPPHFRERWSFKDDITQGGGSDTASDGVDIVKKTLDDLEDGIEVVNRSFVEAVTSYKKIESMFARDLPDAQKVEVADTQAA